MTKCLILEGIELDGHRVQWFIQDFKGERISPLSPPPLYEHWMGIVLICGCSVHTWNYTSPLIQEVTIYFHQMSHNFHGEFIQFLALYLTTFLWPVKGLRDY